MHRVFFDTNNGIDRDLYWLGLPLSKVDLEAMGEDRREGARIVVYMIGELEMEAVLEFNAERSWWAARVDPSTIKYLDPDDS